MQEIIKNPRKIFPRIRLEVSIFKRSAEGGEVMSWNGESGSIGYEMTNEESVVSMARLRQG